MTEILSKPQQYRNVSSSQNGTIVSIPENGAKALVCIRSGADAMIISNALAVDIFLEENARLELLRCCPVTGDAPATMTLNVRQASNSVLAAFVLSRGKGCLEDNANILLEGAGAQASLNGLYDLDMAARVRSVTSIDHAAPSTRSDQLYKSVVRGNAEFVFNGRILVQRQAQLTNAYQLNKNMLLSTAGRIQTKPQLEIFADDVKCSHGAAVGQMDDDQVFYFQTRGIGRDEAMRILVKGFIEDILGRIENTKLRAQAREYYDV